MSLEKPLSRRRLLQSGLVGSIFALSGCLGGGDSVFRDISFVDTHLVVHLRENHHVTRLNIIAPDGSLFARSGVATGVTTVRIQMLDLKYGISSYEHYEPGEYEVVAVLPERTVSRKVELEPELAITDIRQRRGATHRGEFAQLEVVIENTGTAPTWVYDFAYRGLPIRGVSDEFSNYPGLPYLAQPEEADQIILSPGESQTYIGTIRALLFDKGEKQRCYDTIDATVRVGVASGEHLEQRIRLELRGEFLESWLLDSYTCSDISVTLLEGEDSVEHIDEGSGLR